MMLSIEEIASQKTSFVQIATKIPRRLKNMLVLMTVLPISHWFLDEYVGSNLYKDFAVAFPKVRKL